MNQNIRKIRYRLLAILTIFPLLVPDASFASARNRKKSVMQTEENTVSHSTNFDNAKLDNLSPNYNESKKHTHDSTNTTKCTTCVSTSSCLSVCTTTTTVENSTILSSIAETTFAKTTVTSIATTTTLSETSLETISTAENRFTETDFDMPNFLAFGNNKYEVTITSAYQSAVDNYDIVQDTELFSDENNVFLFGHNTKSFVNLYNVEVGDTIELCNNYVTESYYVVKSSIGYLNEGETDVFYTDGVSFRHSEFDTKCIRLMTCVEGLPSQRWVIIATRKDG